MWLSGGTNVSEALQISASDLLKQDGLAIHSLRRCLQKERTSVAPRERVQTTAIDRGMQNRASNAEMWI